VLQAAVVGGAAMDGGNTYTISSALTLVLEGAGGIGQDVVKASVSYALSAGSEIEVLRTTHDKGKTAINLTGNEFGQTIVGNSGNNVIEGKAGADVLFGGAGKDVFVLSNAAVTSPGSANIDAIADYAKGDVVDVTQILSVAAGTNVLTGGYLRVTTGGLVQVDLDGGGDEWVTLSTINGTGAVSVRYLSGGSATTVSVTRVADQQLQSASAANSNFLLAGAVAAAGLASVPAAAESPTPAGDGLLVGGSASFAVRTIEARIDMVDESSRSSLTGETKEPFDAAIPASSLNVASVTSDASALAADIMTPTSSPAELLRGTDGPLHTELAAHSALVAEAVAMPPADVISPQSVAEEARSSAEVARVLADALSGGEGGRSIDALLDALPGNAHGRGAAVEAIATHAAAAIGSWDGGHVGLFASAHGVFIAEALAVHHDSAPPA
jgi:hypothetical protein